MTAGGRRECEVDQAERRLTDRYPVDLIDRDCGRDVSSAMTRRMPSRPTRADPEMPSIRFGHKRASLGARELC